MHPMRLLSLPGLTGRLGQSGRFYVSLPSTNDALADWAAEGAPHGAVVVAAAQSAGRGRHGRQWASPEGLNIYMSVLVRAKEVPPERFHLLPLTAALSSVGAMEQLLSPSDKHALAKWPNDIMVGSRKLGGILIESRGGTPDSLRAIVGIGLNINSRDTDYPEDLRETATSVYIETGKRAELVSVMVSVLNNLDTELAALMKPEGAEDLISHYRQICQNIGQRVRARVMATGKIIEGSVEGIDLEGALLLRAQDGNINKLMAAEIETLRAE